MGKIANGAVKTVNGIGMVWNTILGLALIVAGIAALAGVFPGSNAAFYLAAVAAIGYGGYVLYSTYARR